MKRMFLTTLVILFLSVFMVGCNTYGGEGARRALGEKATTGVNEQNVADTGVGVGSATFASAAPMVPGVETDDGVRGYIMVTAAPETGETLKIGRGKTKEITLLLTFVSHDPELTEVQVTLDPTNPLGYGIEQYYVVTDAQGAIVERGSINVNQLVQYTPSGTVTIKVGETLPVTMRILMDLPKQVQSIQFPLGGVGIDAGEIPIIDAMKVVVENE